MPQPLRSFFAIAAGFLSMMFIVIVLTIVCVKALHLKTGHPTPGYLWFNVAYSTLAAVFGGWLAARIGRVHPLAHGAVLAAIMVLLNFLALRHGTPQPPAYIMFLYIGPPLAAILGSLMARRRGANAG